MVNTIFYFAEGEDFNYGEAISQGSISPYTIVFNKNDKTIWMGGQQYGVTSNDDLLAQMSTILSEHPEMLPVATSTALGAIKIGYVANTNAANRNYGVKLDSNNRAYVSVPWSDTITPEYDDTEVRNLITAQRTRIDTYIQNLSTAIKERVELLFEDAEWITEHVEEGEIYSGIIDEIDAWGHLMGVWNWIDENDHSKGKEIKTSVIEQNVDHIRSSVGVVEDRADALETGLSELNQDVNTVDGRITDVNTSLSSQITQNKKSADGSLSDIVTIISAELGLKTSANGPALTSTADLASVITNGTYSGYGGLSTNVTAIRDDVNDLESDLTQLSSEVVLASDLDTEIGNATSFVNLKNDVNIAKRTLESHADIIASAGLDEDGNPAKWAGFMATVTEDASDPDNPVYTSEAKIHADNIILDGDVFTGTIFASLVDTDTLTTNYATIQNLNAATGKIDNLESENVKITGELAAAKATFTGELIGATGSFSGDVTASSFTAGDANGLSIMTTDDSFNFQWKGQTLAWFSLRGATTDGNGNFNGYENLPENPKGFYLYMINPVDQHLITIDFSNISNGFKDLSGSAQIPVITRTFRYLGTQAQSSNFTDSTVNLYTANDVYYDTSNYQKALPYTSPAYVKYYEYANILNNGHDYDWVILKKDNQYYLQPLVIFRQVQFANGVKSYSTGAGSRLFAIYDNSEKSYIFVKPESSSSTITIPNDTINLQSYGFTLSMDAETGYKFKTNDTITVICMKSCTYSDAQAVVSGAMSTFGDYITDNEYLGQYDYSFDYSAA